MLVYQRVSLVIFYDTNQYLERYWRYLGIIVNWYLSRGSLLHNVTMLSPTWIDLDRHFHPFSFLLHVDNNRKKD